MKVGAKIITVKAENASSMGSIFLLKKYATHRIIVEENPPKESPVVNLAQLQPGATEAFVALVNHHIMVATIVATAMAVTAVMTTSFFIFFSF